MKKGLVPILFTLIYFAGCNADSDPVFPLVPEISLNYISSDTVKEFTDTVLINIHYQDGDGNIGFAESDSFALYVKDIRLADYDRFYVSPLAPLDAVIPITGSLTIPVGRVFRLGTNTTETTRFRVKLRDRSGNWSNEVETENIVIIQ